MYHLYESIYHYQDTSINGNSGGCGRLRRRRIVCSGTRTSGRDCSSVSVRLWWLPTYEPNRWGGAGVSNTPLPELSNMVALSSASVSGHGKRPKVGCRRRLPVSCGPATCSSGSGGRPVHLPHSDT